MNSKDSFKSLSKHYQALVAVAVLIDGRDAAQYLENDLRFSNELVEAAASLSENPPELRIPLTGTLLREVLFGQDD